MSVRIIDRLPYCVPRCLRISSLAPTGCSFVRCYATSLVIEVLLLHAKTTPWVILRFGKVTGIRSVPRESLHSPVTEFLYVHGLLTDLNRHAIRGLEWSVFVFAVEPDSTPRDALHLGNFVRHLPTDRLRELLFLFVFCC